MTARSRTMIGRWSHRLTVPSLVVLVIWSTVRDRVQGATVSEGGSTITVEQVKAIAKEEVETNRLVAERLNGMRVSIAATEKELTDINRTLGGMREDLGAIKQALGVSDSKRITDVGASQKQGV